MAIQYKTNSYVTLDEANAYFANRSDSNSWLALNNNQKEDHLVTATNYLEDSVEFVGVAVSTSQPLAWPRVGSYFEPKYGSTVALPETEVPDRVKRATFEMALHLIDNPGVLSTSTVVEDITVGSISLREIRNPSKLPHMVRKTLGSLRGGSSGSSPWRAW
jgi:hypothetical protein